MTAFEKTLKKNGSTNGLRVAAVIPCFNEEAAIGKVVRDLRSVLPDAKIFVYDNNSTDKTREVAEKAGAIVRSEPRQGKGFVVRRMFADVNADIYVMIDGDNTYDALRAGDLVKRLIDDGLDMVNGAREEADKGTAYRLGHKFGNILLTGFVRLAFGQGIRDMLSGYRVFSRRFVKSFPATSTGFEVETELTVHALDLEMPFAEELTSFQDREPGSESKLHTFSDGFRILFMILKLMKRERPVAMFGSLSALTFLLAIYFVIPVVATYWQTGLVPRYPTLIVSTGLTVVSLLSIGIGLILDTVTAGRREIKRLHYLTLPGVSAAEARVARAAKPQKVR